MTADRPFAAQLDAAAERLPPPLQEELADRLRDLAEQARAHDVDLDTVADGIVEAFAYSPFVARSCVRQPALLADLIATGDLARAYGDGDMASRTRAAVADAGSEAELWRGLRRLRQRELVRVAWRDLSGAGDLDEVMRDLSDLAEQCLDHALAWLYDELCRRHGVPRDPQGEAQRLVVLGMGKLGGGELNFSSDIDLIFCYPQEGHTDGAKGLENHSFFVRLGQRLIAALSEVTEDGFVFRVDMRLRPFGDSGPIAAGFDAMEAYYQSHGREWERYALLKARVVAGDREKGAALLQALRPFVYRRYLDYGTFASLREMKRLIDREAARKGRDQDIKLGIGGIREIEFVAQGLQLIRGGREPGLQTRSLRTALTRLAEHGLLPGYAERQLQGAYAFLRCLENRLQMVGDQQTHSLPSAAHERLRLAAAMGYADRDDFEAALERHMRAAHEQFDQMFAAPQVASDAEEEPLQGELAAVWQGAMSGEAARAALVEAGYQEPGTGLDELEDLRNSRACRSLTSTGRQRLDRLMPLLLGAAGASSHPDAALRRTLRLVGTIAQRSVYLALLVESPLALSQLVRLCAASPWIADHLTRHPLLLDELLDARTLYTPLDRAGLTAALAEELGPVGEDDMEQIMDGLRRFKQAQVLRVAAADVMDMLPLMKVSDQLSWIAEVILGEVLRVSWRQMVARYGRPRCRVDGQPYEPGLAIVGYGKLGGFELGYGSDLDLVFLHDSAGEQQYTDGERAVENAVFFARLGQRIIHILTTYTAAGVLYDVDTRLRPSGAAGLLVSSLQAFEQYQKGSAWTWEHQALVRARVVAGDGSLAGAFERVRHETLERPRDEAAVRQAVREMRERMWQELASKAGSGQFDLKRDPGGIADIEFMVQYEVLAHAGDYPALADYTDNIRILEQLARSGLMPSVDTQLLTDAYRTFRDRIHELTLQGHAAVVAEDDYPLYRREVRRLWQELMED